MKVWLVSIAVLFASSCVVHVDTKRKARVTSAAVVATALTAMVLVETQTSSEVEHGEVWNKRAMGRTFISFPALFFFGGGVVSLVESYSQRRTTTLPTE